MEKKSVDFSRIFEYNPDGILVTDPQGIPLCLNLSARQLLGLPKAGQENREEAVRWEQQQSCRGPFLAIHQALTTGGSVSLVEKDKGGGQLLITACPVLGDNGCLEYIFCNIKSLEKSKESAWESEAERQRSRHFKELIQSQSAVEKFDFQSQGMQNVLSIVAKVSTFDATVLLLGESGVGKNVIANLIHKLSPRKEQPFIYINCGAIPVNLLESELFGYEKGAFTGASSSGHTGLIERAQGGTLFFDEVAELPAAMQVKILHFLNEKVIYKIGGKKPIQIDTRIISATNKDLAALTARGEFREDLFYRLNVLKIEIPPLRERKEDLLNLIGHYFEYYNKKYFLNKTLSSEAVTALLNYSWPGNIRELRNVMEQLAILSEGPVVGKSELPPDIREAPCLVPAPSALSGALAEREKAPEMLLASGSQREIFLQRLEENACSLEALLERFEAQIFQALYQKYKSSYKVAERLGISQSTATRKIKKYIGEENPRKSNS